MSSIEIKLVFSDYQEAAEALRRLAGGNTTAAVAEAASDSAKPRKSRRAKAGADSEEATPLLGGHTNVRDESEPTAEGAKGIISEAEPAQPDEVPADPDASDPRDVVRASLTALLEMTDAPTAKAFITNAGFSKVSAIPTEMCEAFAADVHAEIARRRAAA